MQIQPHWSKTLVLSQIPVCVKVSVGLQSGIRGIMKLPNKSDVILNTDSPNSAEQVEFIEAQYICTCKSTYTKGYALN